MNMNEQLLYQTSAPSGLLLKLIQMLFCGMGFPYTCDARNGLRGRPPSMRHIDVWSVLGSGGAVPNSGCMARKPEGQDWVGCLAKI